MPLGLFKKVGKYCLIGGLGEPPAGSRGSAPVGVQRLELFLNQNCPESHQLTRMVVTHTIHAHTQQQKSRNVRKSRNSDKSRKKRHPWYVVDWTAINTCAHPNLILRFMPISKPDSLLFYVIKLAQFTEHLVHKHVHYNHATNCWC